MAWPLASLRRTCGRRRPWTGGVKCCFFCLRVDMSSFCLFFFLQNYTHVFFVLGGLLVLLNLFRVQV